jgi:hypothetical protein
MNSSAATLVMKSILVLTLFLMFLPPSEAQTHFYLDEPFKRPTTIPDGVASLLRDEIKSVCREDALFQGTDARSLFSASRINLSTYQSAFILKSGHHCLTGVSTDWFWVYISSRRKYRKVLSASGIIVDVLKSRSRGLRDIETNGATAQTNYTRIYKFNGTIYKLVRCLQSTPVGARPKRVPCRR